MGAKDPIRNDKFSATGACGGVLLSCRFSLSLCWTASVDVPCDAAIHAEGLLYVEAACGTTLKYCAAG